MSRNIPLDSTFSLSCASLELPFLLNRLSSVERFPSGLVPGLAVIVDQTLDLLRVPSAFVLGG